MDSRFRGKDGKWRGKDGKWRGKDGEWRGKDGEEHCLRPLPRPRTGDGFPPPIGVEGKLSRE